MSLTQVTIVIPADIVDIANAIAAIFDPDIGGDKTFKVGCSADGNLPATHYVTCTLIEDPYIPLLSDSNQLWSALQYLAQLRGRTMQFGEQDVIDLSEQAVYSLDATIDVLSNMGIRIIPPPAAWPGIEEV